MYGEKDQGAELANFYNRIRRTEKVIYRKIGSLLLANLRYHDELGLYLDEELVGGLSHRVRELFGQLYNMQLLSRKWFVCKENIMIENELLNRYFMKAW